MDPSGAGRGRVSPSRALAALLAVAYLALALNVVALGPDELLRGWVLAGWSSACAVAVLAWFAPPRWRMRLVELLVTTSLCVGAAEVYEARWGSRAPIRLPEGYDRRTKLAVVMDLRASGQLVYPSIPAAPNGRAPLFDGRPTVPLGGISRVLTVHDNDNETGEFKLLAADEHGFNNPSGIWERAPLDLALIGDSFTYGAAVLGERCFADQIRARYAACLNLGMPGMGPLRELGAIREYLPKLAPRFVLWFYFEGNDLDDLASEQLHELFPRYLDEGFDQDLAQRQAEIDEHLIARVERMIAAQSGELKSRATYNDERHSLCARLELQALQRRSLSVLAAAREQPEPENSMSAVYPLLRDVLERAQRAVAGFGGELAFVYLPSHSSLAAQRPDPHRAQVLAIATELHLELVDLEPVFRAEPDPLALFPLRRAGHYAEAGNDLVAREVLGFLERAGVGSRSAQTGART